MSSFGWAVPATRPDSAGPKVRPVTTAISAEGATCFVIVTEGPVAGAPCEPPMLASPQPASSVAAPTPGHPAGPVDGFAHRVLLCLVPTAAAAGP